jgi:bacterioferritin (cytochrome b1)
MSEAKLIVAEKLNDELLSTLKEVVTLFNATRLIMDAEARRIAGEVVAEATAVIQKADKLRSQR